MKRNNLYNLVLCFGLMYLLSGNISPNRLALRTFSIGDAALNEQATAPLSGQTANLSSEANTAVAPAVNSFSLIDADTEQAVTQINDGDVINLALYPNLTQFNIAANVDLNETKRVQMDLTGPPNSNTTVSSLENFAPFAIFGDQNTNPDDYNGVAIVTGSYTISAIPYSMQFSGGTQGPTNTVSFTVVNNPVPAITSYSLIDANTDQVVQVLSDGDQINLASFTDPKSFNIRADVNGFVMSVDMSLVGPNLNTTETRVENVEPFAIFGDQDTDPDDFNGEVLIPGTYQLTATPYELKQQGGAQGATIPLSFTVVGATNVTFTLFNSITEDPIISDLSITNGSAINPDLVGNNFGIGVGFNTSQAIGSVQMDLSGPISHSQIEGVTPYSLFGDETFNGYSGRVFLPGTYTLIATAYTGTAATGAVILTRTISFTVLTGQRPYVVGVNGVLDGTQGVDRFITFNTSGVELSGTPLDRNTVSDDNVTLTRLSTGAKVSACASISGGGDAITLNPVPTLVVGATYRLDILDGANGIVDAAGNQLLPFSIFFRAGVGSCTNDPTIAFAKQVEVTDQRYTSLVIGPDGKLYATTINGLIHRYTINANGVVSANPEVLNVLKNHRRGSEVTSNQKILIGLTFSPSATASNLEAWISYSSNFVFENAPNWDGNIAKLTGPDLENIQDVVIHLPRSKRDHLTNSVRFGPDGALYISQGSNSAMGAYDCSWLRVENLLSAAILRLDVSSLPTSLPFSVKTSEGGTYNPYASGADLTIYASGIRNAYDLVWHSNGNLYVPTNGSAATANAPATPAGGGRFADICDNDGVQPNQPAPYAGLPSQLSYTGPTIDFTVVRNTQNDWLFKIDPDDGSEDDENIDPGITPTSYNYFGHPNPVRDEYILNRGSVDVVTNDQFNQYNEQNIKTEDVSNSRYKESRLAYNFARNKSPNGVIEYTNSTVFNGNLEKKILVTRYTTGDIFIMTVDPTSENVTSVIEGCRVGMAGLKQPLDLVEDPLTGNLYVSDYGAQELVVYKPTTPQSALTSGSPLTSEQEAQVEEDITRVSKLYPNPAQTEVNLEFTKKAENTSAFRLLDFQGQLIREGTLPVKDYRAKLDISDLESGFYILQVNGETFYIVK